MIVKTLCQSGWSKNAKNVPVNARKYWNIRNELHVFDGIVFKNECIVAPVSLQNYIYLLLLMGSGASESSTVK